MPIHDWTRVEAGIFHHFHHGWIEDLSRALNRGLLPEPLPLEATYQSAWEAVRSFWRDAITSPLS
jgi:hypothetical protein